MVPDYLAEALGDVAADTSGAPAGYIPELATAEPGHLGAVFAMADGEVLCRSKTRFRVVNWGFAARSAE
jgi:glutaminase